MKSVKEKAIEFAKENINSLGFVSQEHVDGYAAGANYVLNEIESIIKADLGSYKSQLDKIKQIIEQLKSNQ